MGRAGNGIGRLAHATPKTPSPNPPQGGGIFVCHKPLTGIPSATNYETRATTTGHELQAACLFSDSPDEAVLPAEIRGPCRKKSRCYVVADAQMPECRGRFETFPYRLRAESWSWRFDASTGHRPRATGHPVTITTHHVPTGRTHRSAPTAGETHHESRAATTCHKLQAACRRFVIPAGRAFGSREPVQTGAVSVARTCRQKQW